MRGGNFLFWWGEKKKKKKNETEASPHSNEKHLIDFYLVKK